VGPLAQSNDILTTIGQCTRALIELLHDNRPFETVEQICRGSQNRKRASAHDSFPPAHIPSIRLVVTNASSAEFREKEKKVIDLGFFLGSLRRWNPL